MLVQCTLASDHKKTKNIFNKVAERTTMLIRAILYYLEHVELFDTIGDL